MSTQTSFTDTLREMWETRPPRLPSEQGGNAKIAGVCEGIGVRYRIDPTIVRVMFVVGFFVGGGLPAYLLAWMTMPRYGLALSPVEAVMRRKEDLGSPELKERSTGWWLLIFFVLTSGLFTAGDGLGSIGLLGIGLFLLGWWFLHTRHPEPPAGLLADAPARTMPDPVDLSMYTPAEGTDTPPGRATPPSWDPLGAAPFAWDLPDPAPAPQPPPRKPRVWPWVALGVVGVLGVMSVLATVFGIGVVGDRSYGKQEYAPTSEASLLLTYDGGIGDMVVDFRGLPALTEAHHVLVVGGVGPVNVHLPTLVPVQLSCDSGLGESDCTPGLYNQESSGETLYLTVSGGIGPVKVTVPEASNP
ncbi:PspC domain-containing protein [Corynebacterium sp.]|uniref:PspC domain-containing protein n=1 Tax=Corynebacterium sp. TaxID=1720 RepID=UPI0019BA1F9F|nr:PspC domain-containing protein [Corynebacterium sp.]HHU68427.1 PspC domain-containing protein [Corynebacterium sp.]